MFAWVGHFHQGQTGMHWSQGGRKCVLVPSHLRCIFEWVLPKDLGFPTISACNKRFLLMVRLTLYPPRQMDLFRKLKNINCIPMYDTPLERCWWINFEKLFNKKEESYGKEKNEFKRQKEKDLKYCLSPYIVGIPLNFISFCSSQWSG